MRNRLLWLLVLLCALGGGILWLRAPEGHVPMRVPKGNPPVVALVGTSLTAASTWPTALEARLSGCSIDVTVVAKPGITSAWAVEQLEAIKAAQPGLVVIEFAINDADYRTGPLPWQSLAHHRAMIEALGADHVMLMTTSPAYGKLRQRRPLLPLYFQMYRQLAAAQGTGLADIEPLWRAVPREALPDDLHPTNESAETVIVPALAPLIADAFGKVC